MSGENLNVSQEDARRIELSYKLLYNLQHKNLAFLAALREYEKKRSGGDGESSRMAFIITPLMVNHYNHMHRVYRASMYGKVPDLCDQTGGIMCTDLAALREELATRTIDVNRSLTTAFRTATLPNVQFNFKAERDNVVETAVRMLDSIDIKQPDLTHSIRDDYIQNVRAIQETLTNALEKSKERSAELQSRLSETSRKLQSAEKIIASAPDDAERLRKEVFRLKEKIVNQQALVLKRRVEYDTNTLQLRERESECNLLRELTKRINDRTKEGDEDMKRLRDEMHAYIEGEIGKLKTNNDRIRSEITDHIKRTITSSQEENKNTIELCRSLMSRDGTSETDLNGKLLKLQQDYYRLEQENAELKRQIGGDTAAAEQPLSPVPSFTFSSLSPLHEFPASARLPSRQQIEFPASPRPNDEVPKDNEYSMEYENIVYENVAKEIDSAQDNAELKITIGNIVQRHNALLNDYMARETYMEQVYTDLRTDLESLHSFFTDPNNLDATVRLGEYLYSRGVELKSDYGNLAKFLSDLRSKGLLTTDHSSRIDDLNRTISYASQVVQDQSSQIDTLGRTVVYSDRVVSDLLHAIDIAYDDLGKMLGLDRFSSEVIQADALKEHFQLRFGKNLKDKITILLQNFQSVSERVVGLESENANLILALNEQNNKEPEPPPILVGLHADVFLNTFDGDPTIFEEILQKVWARSENDRLHVLLNTAYHALALERVLRYETYTSNADLKLYNLVEYTVLTEYLRNTPGNSVVRSELVNPKLKEEGYFLEYFISQIGNIQIENYINTLDMSKRNQLALILFNDYYIPIVNKSSFVMSIDGPFANFNMVYRT